MTDNVAVTPGTGATIAADDVGGGVLVQRVKATWGPHGTANDVDTASGKALPIQVRSATGLSPIGEPTDAKSAATDATSVTAISIWKQISASVQAMATALAGALTVSGTVTANAGSGTLAVSVADGSAVTTGSKTDAASTATDATSISSVSIWKQISKSVQAIATSIAGTVAVSGTVTANAGTGNHAVTAASGSFVDGAINTIGARTDAKNVATDATSVSAISLLKQISASVQAVATALPPVTTYSGKMVLSAATSTALTSGNVTLDTNSGALPAAGSFGRLMIEVVSGIVNVSWFGGTASATTGEPMGDGTNVGTDTVNLTGNVNAPTLFSTAGATVFFRN